MGMVIEICSISKLFNEIHYVNPSSKRTIWLERSQTVNILVFFSNWFFYSQRHFQVWMTRVSTTAFRRSASTRSHWRRRRRRRRTTTTATTATPTAPSSVGAAPRRRWRGAPCTACSASLRSSGAATPPSRRSARYAERRRRLLPFLNHVPRFENRTEIHWNRTWFRLQFFYVILMNLSVAKKHFKNYTAGCT